MFDDLLKEVFLFLPAIVMTQVLALAATVFVWSLGVFAGLGLLFGVLWKTFAFIALIIAILAVGQVKAKGLDKP